MDYNSYLPLINNMASVNNMFNAQQVQHQMDFQERLSSTAHQREVADLKAAGLNPVLSAGGSGAAAMQGAAATADNSNISAISSILSTVLQNENARAVADMNNSAAALRQQQSDSAAMDRAVFSAKNNTETTVLKINAEKKLQDAKLSWQAAQNNLDRLEKEKDRSNTKEYQEAQIELKRAEYELKVAQFELDSVQLRNVSSSSGTSTGHSSSGSQNNSTIDTSSYPTDVLSRILLLSHDYVNSLNPKGTTKIFDFPVPNSFIIKYYNDSFLEEAYQRRVNYSLNNSAENDSSNNSAKKVNTTSASKPWKKAYDASRKRGYSTIKDFVDTVSDIRALGAK